MKATTLPNEVELSIVVPTHGRPDLLRTCIESLAGQSGVPEGTELIIVVDGADEATEQLLASLVSPFELHVIVQERARQGAARNRGVEEAHGRYVLFVDDDIVGEPGLVAAHLEVLRNDARAVVLGRIDKVLAPRAPRWARVRQSAWSRHYDRLAAGRV